MKEKLINAAILFVAGLMFFLLLSITGCANIHVTKSGEDWDVSYKVLWRESEDVLIEKDGIRVEFGRAGSDDPVEEIADHIFRYDEAGNVWIDGRINPNLPLD